MSLITTRSGLVHVTGCHACRVCLPGGLPEGEK